MDELTIYNLSVKYPNTVDLVREVERIARAETIEEVLNQINKVTTFYCGDKEGHSVTPKMIVKDEAVKVIEQLKEK